MNSGLLSGEQETSMSKSKGAYSKAGAEIIGALSEFRDAVKTKIPIDQKFTVRIVELDLRPRPYGADDVKKTERS